MITRQHHPKPQRANAEQSLHMLKAVAKLKQKRDALPYMSSAQLRECWHEIFGERPPNAYGIAMLVNELKWRLDSRIQTLHKLATPNAKSTVPIQRAGGKVKRLSALASYF